MKVTVELSDSELRGVCQLTGEQKKGPAIRRLVLDAPTMKRREEIAARFISGQWGTKPAGFGSGRLADRKRAKRRATLRG